MLIREMIRKFIQENFILGEEGQVTDGDSLLEKGVIDSTGVLELVAFIEEKYGITVEDEELTGEQSGAIQNRAECIRKKIKVISNPEVRQSVAP